MPLPFPGKPSERRALGAAVILFAATMAAAAAAEPESFNCVIDPSQTVKLGSPVSGILAEVLVQRGDAVVRGQEIARMESSVEAMTVRFNRFRAESTAKVDAQRQRLELANARLERARQLVGSKIVSQDRFEELGADASVAQQELLREEQERMLARLELERSEAILQQRTIRSPIDGIVVEKRLSAGEYIHQEAAIVTIARLDPLHVETFLPVATYGRIETGMTATVFPDRPLTGAYAATVSVVDRVFDPASGTYGVRMVLRNPDGRLPAGQRCRVSFGGAAAAAKSPAQ